jgi:hypothetical protein
MVLPGSNPTNRRAIMRSFDLGSLAKALRIATPGAFLISVLVEQLSLDETERKYLESVVFAAKTYFQCPNCRTKYNSSENLTQHECWIKMREHKVSVQPKVGREAIDFNSIE